MYTNQLVLHLHMYNIVALVIISSMPQLYIYNYWLTLAKWKLTVTPFLLNTCIGGSVPGYMDSTDRR